MLSLLQKKLTQTPIQLFKAINRSIAQPINFVQATNGAQSPVNHLILDWIAQGSTVLDLGCGDGTLLAHLAAQKNVTGYGLELDPTQLNTAIARGVCAISQDLNLGLANFADGSFDTVLLMQTLQSVLNPKDLMTEMLRVGNQGIVTFPNFAYWQNRVHLGLKGLMPVSKTIPFAWYDTPNIHLCTFKDFEQLCAQNGILILDSLALGDELGQNFVQYAPNLLANMAIYRIAKK